MFRMFQVLTCVVAMGIGAAIGAVAVFFGTFYACVFIDWLRGAGGGNGIVTVGWLFCFFTVPAGL